jgi:hypothetical protein
MKGHVEKKALIIQQIICDARFDARMERSFLFDPHRMLFNSFRGSLPQSRVSEDLVQKCFSHAQIPHTFRRHHSCGLMPGRAVTRRSIGAQHAQAEIVPDGNRPGKTASEDRDPHGVGFTRRSGTAGLGG